MTMQPDPLYTVTVRSPDGAEVVYSLGKNQGLLVGRDETCDIALPSERVSGRHARIFTEDEDLRVEDLGSESGVYVGGARLDGLQAVRPGPAIEIGEFQIRVRRVEHALASSPTRSSQVGTLIGIGKQKGQRLELAEKMVVGRDRQADLVIRDDSVSRRHAEFSLENGRLILRDLASSNGTFHNERPLGPNIEAVLAANDIVGFGDTRFRFIAGSALPSGSGTSRSAVIIGALLLLIVGLVVFGQLNQSAHEGGGNYYSELDENPSYKARIIGEARIEEGDWAGAVEAFEEALHHDPVAGELRVLLRQARAELKQEELLAEVDRLERTGQPLPAFDRLLDIDPNSRAYARARLVFRKLSGEAIRRSQTACTEAISAKDNLRIAEQCGRYLDLSCHSQKPPANLVRSLNQSLSHNQPGASWSCPPELAHWFGASSSTDTGEELLEARYSDENIRRVVLAYYRGAVDDARREADKLSGATRSKADELIRQMSLVDARYKEGSSALIGNDLSRADQAFQEALRLDGELVPAPGRSTLSGQIRNSMGQALARQGRQALNQGNHTEAFAAWSRGLEYSPTDSQLLAGIRELESVANSMAGQSCQSIERAMKLTLPESATHQRLKARLENECS